MASLFPDEAVGELLICIAVNEHVDMYQITLASPVSMLNQQEQGTFYRALTRAFTKTRIVPSAHDPSVGEPCSNT